jgi:hypothetical protein
MMEAVRTSETSVDNHFTRQYNPEDSSEHHDLVLAYFITLIVCFFNVVFCKLSVHELRNGDEGGLGIETDVLQIQYNIMQCNIIFEFLFAL